MLVSVLYSTRNFNVLIYVMKVSGRVLKDSLELRQVYTTMCFHRSLSVLSLYSAIQNGCCAGTLTTLDITSARSDK